jgi:hypothetical protein
MTESSPAVATSDIIERIVANKTRRAEIAAEDKKLVDEFRSLEMEMLVRLDEQGMTKASTVLGTVSITETVLPQVTDWDQVYEHIRDTGDFYLLQKRPAAAAFRELHEAGIEIPGIDPYTKKAISLRKK